MGLTNHFLPTFTPSPPFNLGRFGFFCHRLYLNQCTLLHWNQNDVHSRISSHLAFPFSFFAFELRFFRVARSHASWRLSTQYGSRRFFYRRVTLAKYDLPKAFHLIGIAFIIGLLANIAGLYTQLSSDQTAFPSKLETALGFYSTFLILLLGVGSRLFTGIFGMNLTKDNELKGLSSLAFVFVLTLTEVIYPEWRFALAILRALALLLTLYFFWCLPQPPRTKSWESRWSYLFWICVSAGFLLEPFVPKSLASSKHFLFIGGYLGLTLVIASRIILAHGGYLMGYPEPIIKRLNWSFGLLSLSLLSRETALVPALAARAITFSGVLTLVALILWASTMVPKIFKRNELIFRKGPQ